MVIWGASLGAVPRLFIVLLATGTEMPTYPYLMLKKALLAQRVGKRLVNLCSREGRNYIVRK
jgi:hypothetical protein